jgi:hypothetical protein
MRESESESGSGSGSERAMHPYTLPITHPYTLPIKHSYPLGGVEISDNNMSLHRAMVN